MKTLHDVYQLITNEEHYWRFEASTSFIQRMASTLMNINLDEALAQQLLDIMKEGQARMSELRTKELDYSDMVNGINAIQQLYINIPLKLIKL